MATRPKKRPSAALQQSPMKRPAAVLQESLGMSEVRPRKRPAASTNQLATSVSAAAPPKSTTQPMFKLSLDTEAVLAKKDLDAIRKRIKNIVRGGELREYKISHTHQKAKIFEAAVYPLGLSCRPCNAGSVNYEVSFQAPQQKCFEGFRNFDGYRIIQEKLNRFLDAHAPPRGYSNEKTLPALQLGTRARMRTHYLVMFHMSNCGPYQSGCSGIGIFASLLEAETASSEFGNRCAKAWNNKSSKRQHYSVDDDQACLEAYMRDGVQDSRIANARASLQSTNRKNLALDFLALQSRSHRLRQVGVVARVPSAHVDRMLTAAMGAPSSHLHGSASACTGFPQDIIAIIRNFLTASKSDDGDCTEFRLEDNEQPRYGQQKVRASIKVVPFQASMLSANGDGSRSLHFVLSEPLDVGWGETGLGLLAVADGLRSANALVEQIGKKYLWDCMVEEVSKTTEVQWPNFERANDDVFGETYCGVYKTPLPAVALLGSNIMRSGKDIGDFGVECRHPRGQFTRGLHTFGFTQQGQRVFKMLIKASGGDVGSDTSGVIAWADQLFMPCS